MKIGVYSVGSGVHHDISRFLLESLKSYMPDVPVFHLTDEATECFAEPIRRPLKPLAVHRLEFHAELPGEWLFVDTDIVFTQDVRSVFDQDFDIAYAQRQDDCEYSRAMPVNLGVIFSRCNQFWKDIQPAVEKLPQRLKDWDGAQLATGWYATRPESWWVKRGHKPYKILKLPQEYNYAPEHKDDVSAAILHYKGKKKSFLGPEFAIKSIRPN